MTDFVPNFVSHEHPQQAACGERIVRRLQEHGYEAVFAGGCVRDALRGAPVKDIDIATSATPDQIAELFPAQSVGVGKSFGVMLVIVDGVSFDVATFRTDGGYQDGRHPESVAFDSAEHDALRRDFTVNALFYDPVAQRIVDYTGGEDDLKAGIVRAVGNPVTRFREDRLRMLRAVRFAAVCGWKIESATWEALCAEAPALGCVSAERIRTEFVRMLCESPVPSKAMDMLLASGLLREFFPEVVRLKGCLQDPQWHPEGDVWNHTCKMLDLQPAPRDPELVWSVLLHDIGKPDALRVGTKPDGSPWYRTPGHADIGAEMAPGILRRFKEKRETIDRVTAAVRHHMQFVELPRMRTTTARKMLGRDTMPLELELHRLDCLSSHAKLDLYTLAKETIASYANEPILPPAIVTGKLLIGLGWKPGPAMGNLLKKLYERQLEGEGRLALYTSVFDVAPCRSRSGRTNVAFEIYPGDTFELRPLWDRLCSESAWNVLLVVGLGVTWTEPYNPQRRLYRLVGDCAGNAELPDLSAYIRLGC